MSMSASNYKIKCLLISTVTTVIGVLITMAAYNIPDSVVRLKNSDTGQVTHDRTIPLSIGLGVATMLISGSAMALVAGASTTT